MTECFLSRVSNLKILPPDQVQQPDSLPPGKYGDLSNVGRLSARAWIGSLATSKYK